MKFNSLYIILCTLPFLACAPSNPMQTELQKMHDEDQEIRKQSAALRKEATKDTVLFRRMSRFDSVSTQRLKELLGHEAWFTKEAVGKKGLQAAFILLQHSPDYDFQKRCLPYIETQAK